MECLTLLPFPPPPSAGTPQMDSLAHQNEIQPLLVGTNVTKT
jgi:hypothetical protein